MWCWGGDDYGLPPGPSRERRATSAARPPAYRLHIAYVTPSRRATRTASPNSPSACACHLDVVTLRRFTPATGGGGGGGTYRISAAPSGRGRCRRCRAVITNGETRLEVCAFVRPGRYTLLFSCTAPACIDAPLSTAILSVYKTADRVPVEAALDGSAEARRVQCTIAAASGGGVNENG